jgi:hypothetical protein
MNQIVRVLFVSLVAILTGCGLFPLVTGSGDPVTVPYTFSGFTGIEASHSFAVTVVPDDSYSVSLTFDDNLRPYVVARIEAGKLVLGLKDGCLYPGVTLEAEVHMPSVASLDASGASSFAVPTGFSSMGPVSVELSGASTCRWDGLACGDLAVTVSGASTAIVSGSAAAETVDASGASTVNLIDCAGASAGVVLSGASEGWIDVGTGSVDCTASGASTLYFTGTPALRTLELSGASHIVRVQ